MTYFFVACVLFFLLFTWCLCVINKRRNQAAMRLRFTETYREFAQKQYGHRLYLQSAGPHDHRIRMFGYSGASDRDITPHLPSPYEAWMAAARMDNTDLNDLLKKATESAGA